ncbi:MAG: hypothetical protein HYS12_01410 [Planctomycetes bacterium]|nr:hypothetical protein [Planctomycetota bacterium]
MNVSSLSRLSFVLWALLALALLVGLPGDLPAATTGDAGATGTPAFAATVTRTRVVQIAACAMALALFIIMRSCKH